MKSRRPVIAVHAGAGVLHSERSEAALTGVKKAAKIGFDILSNSGSAVDAVIEAVVNMEDEGVFNAGYGSSLNIEKRIEMEASVIDGKKLQAGAVGLLKNRPRFCSRRRSREACRNIQS